MLEMSRYKLEYYFTLREFANTLPYQDEDFGWYSLFHTFLPYAPIYTLDSSTPPVEILKPYIKEVLDMVFSRYSKHYIYWCDHEELTEDDAYEIALKLANIIMNSYDRYAPLYKYYKDKEDNLMDMIKSETDSGIGYNDTPQNGGAFEDENHRTNYTESKSTVKIDGATPIERLKEIKDKLTSILFDWSEEFDKIFIEEANV